MQWTLPLHPDLEISNQKVFQAPDHRLAAPQISGADILWPVRSEKVK